MFLKHLTPQNIVWGGSAGAAPLLLGWVAVGGEIHLEAVVQFLIIFLWTPPHFWALAFNRADDYARADVPMLPVVRGIPYTKLQILLPTVALVCVTIVPFIISMSGPIYLAGATGLGIGFLARVVKLY